MSQKDIFFLPDISGFSEFVNSTEVSHSKHIIKELIEMIIDASHDAMHVVEIEGDAVFMVGQSSDLSLADVLENVETIYIQFHDHLKMYESKRICPCGACTTAMGLTLKFIVHLGSLEYIEIQGQRKPYGADVILAHRLLKNDIDDDAYVLVSCPKDLTEVQDWNEHTSSYDQNSINYRYKSLHYLDVKIQEIQKDYQLKPSAEPMSFEKNLDVDIYRLYELISNLNFRTLWNTDPDGFEFDPERVNRIGDHHVCVINQKLIDFETIHSEFGDDTLVYGEVTKQAPIVDELYNYFILKKVGDQTKLTVLIYLIFDSGLKRYFLMPLARRFSRRNLKKLFDNLESIIAEKSVDILN